MSIIILGFIFWGLYNGLIKMLGKILGLIIGVIVAVNYYLPLHAWASHYVHINGNLSKVLIFIILFALAAKLATLVFALIEKLFNLIAIIPFMKLFNRLLGGILGLGLASLLLGLIIFMVSRYAILETFFSQYLLESKIAPLVLKVVNIILPIIPDSLKQLNSLL